MVDLNTQAALVNRLVGTPYVRLGRGPGGVDCWGLVCLCAAELGLRPPPDPRVAWDSRLEVSNAIEAGCNEFGVEVEPRDLCIVFQGKGNRHFHAGFSLAGGVLHAKSGLGVMHSKWSCVDFRSRRCYDWSAHG